MFDRRNPIASLVSAATVVALLLPCHALVSTPTNIGKVSTRLFMSDEASAPSTFREAEVLGLRLMQEGKHEEALAAFQNGLKLPGSRPDVVRKNRVAGPSPVGGSKGGTDSETVMNLDEFELQAAHYNIACAYAQLGNLGESVYNLELSFKNGFDNYATVKGDPDLSSLQETSELEDLLSTYEKKRGISFPGLDFAGPAAPKISNPFGLFGK